MKIKLARVLVAFLVIIKEESSHYRLLCPSIIDYNNINYVYVVNNLLKDEQKELEKSAKDE